MPSKKLKLLTNQRKITDFKADFVPQNQNGPSDTPQTPSEDEVHETADVSDEKSSEKRDFYHVQALISMPFTADFEMLVQLCCFCVLFCLY